MTNIQLNNHIGIENFSHIFYLYDDIQCYKQNLLSYIKTGISLNQHMVIIEDHIIYNEVVQLLSLEEQLLVHFIDNFTFYRYYEGFHIEKIVNHFASILNPLLSQELKIRTWANVIWNKDLFINSLEEFEEKADCCVNDLRIMSVCAYFSSSLNVNLQTAMMKNHKYLMTDEEFVESTLYNLGTS